MVVYGYARVSTKEQNLDRQIDALRAFPVEEERIIAEKMSGKDFNRPGFKALCEQLRPGDVLVVKSIDRLGRSYEDILEQWRTLTRELRVDLVVLDMPLLDTRTSEGDITGTLISDIVLQLLSYVAQVERENTRQRQAEGIASAQARGVKFGRPAKVPPPEFEAVLSRWLDGAFGCRKAASLLGVSHTTFLKWARKCEGR